MFITSRPVVGDEQLNQIRAIIEENPEMHRTQLSKELCELWNWRFPSGDLKDISCRYLLRKLAAQGKIVLPEPRAIHGLRYNNVKRSVAHLEHDTTPIIGHLNDILPLSIEIVDKKGTAEFASMLAQYHYLGFDRTYGQNMKYMVRGRDSRPVALLTFGAAAWKCKGRDDHIG